MKRLVFILASVFLLFASSVYAANIGFSWDANTESDLVGYRLFQRDVTDTYDYTAPAAEIPVGTEICIIVVDDQDWDNEQLRWVLRAFDLAGNESDDSNECGDRNPGVVRGFG